MGYLNVGKDIDGHLVNTIDIDPNRGPLVTWAFEQYATGDYSLVRLQQELADRGFTTRRTAKWEEKPVSRSQIALILRDPYYLGMVPYKGQVYPGRHAALVTSDLFDRVQQVLDVRMRRNQRDIVHTHFLRGMLRCGRCHNRQLIFSQVTNPQGTMYDYFLCAGRQEGTCDLLHLPVALVEEAMQRKVQSLQLTPEAIATMRDEVMGHLEQRLTVEREAHAQVRKELAALDTKEERLLDLVADGSLTTEKVRERLGKLQVQRLALRQRLEATADIVQQQSDTLLHLLTLLEQPGTFYATARDTTKRKLLAAYFAQIWIDDDGHQITTETERQPLVAQIEASARQGATHENATEQPLGGIDSSDTGLYPQGMCLSSMILVGRVDRCSNNWALLGLTPGELAKLAEQSRAVQSPTAPVEPQDVAVRRLRRRLSPQMIVEIVARYNAGEDTPDLSRAYGISRGGLRKLLLAEGVAFRKQPMTPGDAERATRLYERGLTIDEVVEQVGYSFGTVRRMLHANGVAVRERGGRRG